MALRRARAGFTSRSALTLACGAWITFAALAALAALAAPARANQAPRWPDGTEVLAFENLEGIVLVTGRLHGETRDTTGLLVLDTGAGHLALDAALAHRLGILDRIPDGPADIGIASRPLRRLELGGSQRDLVSPVLTVDGEIVRRVTDRPVLGLLGQSLFRNQALWMDFREQQLAIVPVAAPAAAAPETDRERIAASRAALAGVLGPGWIAMPFVLEGDGKIIVPVHLSNPAPPRWSRALDLILDTGATKTVLFPSPTRRAVPGLARWNRLEGLVAPTLFGSESAAIAMAPAIEIRTPSGRVRQDSVDVALLGGDLGPLLSRATGRTVHGLLGYSFLRHFRMCVDYRHRVLWLERLVPEWNDRPYEYSHPGIQIERVAGALRVIAVAKRSPAEAAGVLAGDDVVAVDGEDVSETSVIELSRRLEGEPGTTIELLLRRAGRELRVRVTRRQLL